MANNNQIYELIDQKIDSLVANEDQVDAFSDEVRQLLQTCNAKRQFFEAVKKLVEKAFAAERSDYHIYGKFIANLIGTTIVCAESGKLCSFKDALCSCLTHPVALNQEAFDAFHRKLPFMNELFKLRLVQWSALKVLITGLQDSDEISIRYLFELVRNVDHLVDEHVAIFPKFNTDPYWCNLVGRIKQAYDDRVITDQSVLEDMYSFFQALKHKHRWCSALISSNPKKRKSSKSESECIPSKRSSPSVLESQANTPIGRVMDLLSKDAHYMTIAISKLKTILANSPTSVAFTEGVYELLNATYAADPRVFPACIQLLESLRDLCVNDVTFPDAVSKCTAAKNTFNTIEQINRFAGSFRLTNELYRIGLVPKDTYQSYAANLTNGENELSAILLYKIVVNVDKLVESGYAKMSADDAKFWTCQNRRLISAIQRNVVKSSRALAEISQFLKTHEMKGGWDQSPVERKPEDLELMSMISGMALVGNFKTWLWPLVAKFESVSSPSEFCDALERFLVKMCELIVDERTLNEACEICQLLVNTDFGGGNSFITELQNFCLKFLSGKEARESQEHACLKTANPSLEKLLYVLMKRRQGCTRLIGHLYLLQVFEIEFLVKLCDALLAARAFPATECLFWLFTDIGRQLSSVVIEKNLLTWWNTFFEELAKLLQSTSTPDEVKRLAKAILVEKGQWPMPDSKTRARDNLSKMLSDLTSDLRKKSLNDFGSVMQNIRDLLANEISDHHTQQMFEILLTKIDKSFKEESDIDSLPANPTPLPTLP